jgi:hypothetical protein
MRRFLNNLFRDFRTTGTARGGRRAPRRATLQVEGLEDRLALTSASQIGAVLTINASPGDRGGLGVFSVNPVQFRTITLESDGHGQIDVNDSVQGLVNHFTISSIKNVVVVVQGLDVVTINDSLGMPFATGTTVTVGGNGQYVNTMNLVGSLPINGDEQCVAPLPSASTSAASFIKVDGVTFDYTSAIQSVADGLLITGTFDVETSSPEVFLYGSDHHDQELLNLRGRYETLNFANKNQVVLNEYAANAGIILEATTPDAPNELFSADMHGAGDVTTIFSTPYKVITDVETTVAPVANQAAVQVDANNGPVTVEGNSSTKMTIGYEPAPFGGLSTKGIQASITVLGLQSLIVSDSANYSTQENVKVTDRSISGTGLFGNNSVIVNYFNVGALFLDTGHVSDTYTVVGSQPGALFSSTIQIFDYSAGQFHADVFVDSGSHLNLSLNKVQPGSEASLTIHPGGGNVALPGRIPRRLESGTADVYFAGILSSQVSVLNFDAVGVQE